MKHKVLTDKQPYAWLICAGIKPIENRTWKCPQKYIGQRMLIHASAKDAGYPEEIFTCDQMTEIYRHLEDGWNTGTYKAGDLWDIMYKTHSAIIGSVIIADCVQNHPSIWAMEGYWHWVLKDPILFDEPILNVKGRLGFWDVNLYSCEECGKLGRYSFCAEHSPF